MTYTYMVNATLTLPAWIEVEAETEAEAVATAKEASPRDFEYDMGGAEVEFNVDPLVSEIPF